MREKLIAHADMDAFYAAVEQLDDPALRGRPILVGSPGRRGVVLTASYEARPYRVGSAMPMSVARRRCPEACIVAPRFERYRELSRTIMAVFADFAPRVEALSLDEAFLDLGRAVPGDSAAETIGRALKAAVREATGGLTVSVGMSATKYVAKVASDFAKPDGLTVVPGRAVRSWLAPLPVAALWGAGPKLQQALIDAGLSTIGAVAAADPAGLERRFGRAGAKLHALANGDDPRDVEPSRSARSIGSERTLDQDIGDIEAIRRELRRSADAVGRRLRGKQLVAGGVRVRLKRSDFKSLTRQTALAAPTDASRELYAAAVGLADEIADTGPFRLVGVAAYDLAAAASVRQLGLPMADDRRARELDGVLDRIAARFGPGIVTRASELGRSGPDSTPNLDFLDDDQ